MDVKRIVAEAADEIEGIRKAIRAGLDEMEAPGLVEPTDAEFMAWVQTMAGAGDAELGIPPGKYPPVLMVAPDGALVTMSSWLAMLDAVAQPQSEHAGRPLVDGGAEILARLARIQRKSVAM